MKKTALVTGASGGIGLELAREHAKTGGDLILVARSKDKLDQFKAEIEAQYGVSVCVITKDLTIPNAPQEVYDEVKSKNLEVDYLINNAGVGAFDLFVKYPFERDAQMIALNITELTHFCKLFLPDMLARKSGKIMNVASTAGFQPGPTMAVYFATKAYVLHFSEALANEVGDQGVTVTALCPGATESGFAQAATMQESKLMKNQKLPSSAEVAKYGYRAMLKGKTVAIHGLKNYLQANSVRFATRNFVVKLARKMTDK